MTTKPRLTRLHYILFGIALLLFIPLIAMQFTNEVQWKSGDFAVMAILLTSVGLSSEWILRKNKKRTNRVLLIGLAIISFLTIWAELAVGLF